MKWTLSVIVLMALAAGISAATITTRSPSCPRGQAYSRGRCVALTNATTPRSIPTPAAVAAIPPPANSSGCPLGQVMRNGKCSPKQCPAGMAVNREGLCDCASGFHKDNNRCVNTAASQSCRSSGGHLSRKGNCVTPTQKPTTTKNCPKDHKLNAQGKCEKDVLSSAVQSCPSGQRKNRKGNCIPIVAGQSCGQDLWVDEKGNCGSARPNNGCPAGKIRNGYGNCVKNHVCTAGQAKDKGGVCQPQSCPENHKMVNGVCEAIKN